MTNTDDGIPFVTISDMSCYDFVEKTNKSITEIGIEDKKLKVLPKGTILYSIYATIGKVSELNINACINQALIAIIPNDILEKKYLKYSLKAMEDYVLSQCFLTSQNNLNSFKVKNFNILILSKEEQKLIVETLNKKCSQIDDLIQNQQQQIEKLKKYKQSLITEVVTKGLEPNVPMKDSGVKWIGEIAENNNIYRLKFLLNGNMQYGANESGSKDIRTEIRYIRITDINEDGTLKNNEDNLYLTKEQALSYILKEKDVLFARSGATVGKTFIYFEKYGKSAFAGYLIKAECNKNKLLPEYLLYYTQSNIYEKWKNMIFIQSTIQNIGASKYSNMLIIVPSIYEQEKISNYLDKKCFQIDNLIKIKEEKIQKLNDYKKAIIYEYVTGKKEA